jgi:hypothetical protein
MRKVTKDAQAASEVIRSDLAVTSLENFLHLSLRERWIARLGALIVPDRTRSPVSA